MGLFDFLKRKPVGRGKTGLVGTCPSRDYPAPVALFEEAIDRHFEFHAGGGWASFEAEREGGSIVVVQVTGIVINTCLETVDLAGVLTNAGLAELAARAGACGDGLSEVRLATPRELALAVNAVFRNHFGLPDGYSVTAEVEA